ncbi:MAG: hypothetical protein A2104_02070 [Candidatus Melainabacteria bacterium GWF2_32_7]|nr:MAG: hypothetical protein A2104_02070 [Candidatus Melainabacteria bacterium GWF2_32_7]
MRKKSFLLLEVFIWIIILGGLVFLGIDFIKQRLDSRQTHQVMFRDVDSLLLGAPVRVMGIDVGYVSEIEPIGDEVYITFIITNNKVTVPNGSTISIQFTGLAGSKSIEIKPPKAKVTDNYKLNVSEPVRINSLMQVQTEISESVLDSSKNALKMFGKGGVDIMKSNIEKVNNGTNDAIVGVRDIKVVLSDANGNMHRSSSYVKEILNDQSENLNSLYGAFTDQDIDQQIKDYIKSFNDTTKGMSKSLDKNELQKIRKEISSDLQGFNKNVINFSYKARDLRNKGTDFARNSESINSVLNTFRGMLNSISDVFNPKGINKLRAKSSELKEKTEEINKKI